MLLLFQTIGGRIIAPIALEGKLHFAGAPHAKQFFIATRFVLDLSSQEKKSSPSRLAKQKTGVYTNKNVLPSSLGLIQHPLLRLLRAMPFVAWHESCGGGKNSGGTVYGYVHRNLP